MALDQLGFIQMLKGQDKLLLMDYSSRERGTFIIEKNLYRGVHGRKHKALVVIHSCFQKILEHKHIT